MLSSNAKMSEHAINIVIIFVYGHKYFSYSVHYFTLNNFAFKYIIVFGIEIVEMLSKAFSKNINFS